MAGRTAAAAIPWGSLSKRAFDELNRRDTPVLVSCSPLEVHGPHLPLAADALQADALAARVWDFLPDRHRTRSRLQLPLVYAASDVVAQPGSLHFSAGTTVRVLREVGTTLARQGFRDLVVSNFHGGPRHVLAIEKACERVNRAHGTRMVSLFSLMRHRFAQRGVGLGEVFDGRHGVTRADFRGDTHAGVLETSQLLATAGALVDPDYKNLPQRTVRDWLTDGGLCGNPLFRISAVRAFAGDSEYFVDHTYSGAPAAASAELGRELLDALAEPTAEALAEVLDGTLPPERCHTPRTARFWRLNPLATRVATRLLRLRNPIG